ncbi:MAG: AgmX/PglI C-terminal domain-containing protein [Myxococcota bacterium]|nr:AgmX/PglI C-terminal domain-containing protein [Myxococcota bacterium]MDW8362083.1 AgmX/PglI C-terminal domain-containing protein [Myxococcales bacterium]
MSAHPTPTVPALRVVMVWGGDILAEHVLTSPRLVVLGAGRDTLGPLPDDGKLPERVVLLRPHAKGYTLHLDAPGLGGAVWLDGQRTDVRSIASRSPVPIGLGDRGVVTIGPLAVFFQYVRPAPALRRRGPVLPAMFGPLLASQLLSAFLIGSVLVLAFLARREMDVLDPLELPEDLVARFLVTPPPEELTETRPEAGGTEVEDPGLRDRDETGGRRHQDEEGRVGRPDARQEQTEVAGEHTSDVAARVRQLGLLGVLAGGGGNEIADALRVPDVSDVLSGLGHTRTILGVGSGGAGLRGVGTGGGGTGPGGLFGAGGSGSGIGAGAGGGLGRGQGGIGVKGRPRQEVAVSVEQGTPRVNGYLSAEQINRVVRANAAAIRYCYEVEVQRQPSLRGRVVIQWRINLQGAVTTARVEESSLRNATVEGCVVRQVRRWRFPEPDGGEVVVSYPFIFGIQG